ncbi:hypothetical protein LTR36_007175 [Oleoguttula mirabilis]|uniref:Conserved oligomeric Golgi complex subunit 8 n=1 Tax=Oleoguttula mirabilis TaxID=1507867 RepID=A0AAV9JAP7_9PEZI|nr:hypothetical protein LTR36_007175 [Oleoguttula mirabilis]
MSDLYELLAPYFDVPDSPSASLPPPSANDPQTTSYLNRLSTLSLSDISSTEPQSLLHAAQSHLRSLQALSKRSHKAVIASSSHLGNLTSLLPSLGAQAAELKDELPHLETAATDFAHKYDRSTENAVLDRRKRAMLLSRNVDRVSDVLDLPTLLSSTVSAAQAPSVQSSSASASTSYASALDLHAHIKRLNALYPQSQLVGGISKQAEVEIQNLTSILITSLQSSTLKLAAAMRTIGWLRRVAPDLADDDHGHSKPSALSTKSLSMSASKASADGALGSLFLVCRLHTLHTTLEALEPLRELADQESSRRRQTLNGTMSRQQPQSAASGSQSERYLKRYVEIFREQSFAIVSMYKSVFPAGVPTPEVSVEASLSNDNDQLLPLPSPLSSFALHLVELLTATLRAYMPNVTDKQVRESLLTQVLYCAGSLGRLGADFGMMIALLEEELMDEDGAADETDGEPEWVQVMKKHRIQASRLEVLARGVGSGRKASTDVLSPTAMSAG